MPVALLIAVAVAWVAYACVYWCRPHRHGAGGIGGVGREPPRLPRALPLLGHSYIALWNTADGLMDALESLTNECLDVGGVGTTTFGLQKMYVITDPEVARIMLNTCMEKDTHYHFFRSWFRRGLFTRTFDGYLERRKLLMPGFSQKALDGFYDSIDKQARQLTDSLSKLPGRSVNLETHLSMFTLQTILMTQLGMTEEDIASLHDKMADCLAATQEMLKLITERFVRFWCHVPWIYKWTNHWKKEQGLVNILHELSEEIVKRRRLALEGKSKRYEHTDTKFETQTPIFLDILLQLAQRGATDITEVREEVDGILFAGHDTSASTLMFTCALLAAHPEVQETLYTELNEVLGDSKRITKQHLSSLKYTEAVLKETMRLHPVVGVIGRLVDKDVCIKQYTLRAGSKAVVPSLGVHQHALWSDCAEFRPARWLAAPPGDAAAAAAAYIPFSSGRRSCLGKLYSMAVMKTALAHLVRRCRLRLDAHAARAPLRRQFRILLKPISGHHVAIQLREKSKIKRQ